VQLLGSEEGGLAGLRLAALRSSVLVDVRRVLLAAGVEAGHLAGTLQVLGPGEVAAERRALDAPASATLSKQRLAARRAPLRVQVGEARPARHGVEVVPVVASQPLPSETDNRSVGTAS
jgi:hypothetical protein